jgi:Tfp pilus assembly protein PilO
MTGLYYLLTLCLPLGTVLIVFGMRYFSAIQQARARLANDDAYRRIAESAAAAQTQTVAALSSIEASLADVRTRVASVEKILRDVQ